MHALLLLLLVLRLLPLMIFLLHFHFFLGVLHSFILRCGSCVCSLWLCSSSSWSTCVLTRVVVWVVVWVVVLSILKEERMFLLIKQQLPEQLPGSDRCRFSIGFLRKVLRGGSPWPMKFSSLGSCWGSCLGSCCQLLGFRRSKTRGGEFGRVWLQQSRRTWNRAAPL